MVDKMEEVMATEEYQEVLDSIQVNLDYLDEYFSQSLVGQSFFFDKFFDFVEKVFYPID